MELLVVVTEPCCGVRAVHADLVETGPQDDDAETECLPDLVGRHVDDELVSPSWAIRQKPEPTLLRGVQVDAQRLGENDRIDRPFEKLEQFSGLGIDPHGLVAAPRAAWRKS